MIDLRDRGRAPPPRRSLLRHDEARPLQVLSGHQRKHAIGFDPSQRLCWLIPRHYLIGTFLVLGARRSANNSVMKLLF
jgi:hypothetical protein